MHCPGYKIPGTLSEDRRVLECQDREKLNEERPDSDHMLKLWILQTNAKLKRWVGAKVRGSFAPVMLEFELDPRNNRRRQSGDHDHFHSNRLGRPSHEQVPPQTVRIKSDVE